MAEFKITTSSYFYAKDDKDVEILKGLGFEFDDEMMIESNPTIRISTIGGLLRFIKKCGHGVIINLPYSFDEGGLPTIEIYNDYRE